jgi:hypothetical protein
MRLLLSLLFLALPALAGWPRVLDSLGLDPAALTVVEGAAPEYGFVATAGKVEVRSVLDTVNPSLQIIWEKPLLVTRYQLPEGAIVFTRERWSGAPLAAGLAREGRVVFWTAVSLGEKGFERFPYLPQALAELGLRPRVEARDLWIFFDSSYRLRADFDYLAERWRRGGVAALHVAAWQYWEPDAQRDQWLAKLIEACHRHAIVVFAWVEFPHVSEKFWNDHPEWREQTATGQDAHLDWRKLMNLANVYCAAEVEAGLRALTARFDWDGVNLGELYFESLEGYLNPGRFTPFNAEVRAAFQQEHGFDPREMYDAQSKRHHERDARPMRLFLEYRAALAGRLQEEWLARLEALRASKPWLHLTLTHIDDRFDASMRDSLGADAERLLPAAQRHGATFLVEDPATVWHLGPERYEEMARRYAKIAPAPESLAIDINVVERYQDVYPTKQQTGAELFQLVHSAARWFPRVALYFENSILPVDWPLLAGAASPARTVKQSDGALEIDTPRPVAVDWRGCALVNGEVWRVMSGDRLLLPAGQWKVTGCAAGTVALPRLLDFNGTLLSARVKDGEFEFSYSSQTRAIAVLPDGHAMMLDPGTRTVRIH